MFFSSKKKIKKRRDNLCKEADIFIQVHFVRERNSEKYKFNGTMRIIILKATAR